MLIFFKPVSHGQQILNSPPMIGHGSGHCWLCFETFSVLGLGHVRPDDVVIEKVQRHGMGQVFTLFAERICKAGEPLHLHPHGQIFAFDAAR
jgi:hypothetical protein